MTITRTMHLQSPPLTIGRTVLKGSVDHNILGVTLDSKITFEKHLRSVSRAACQTSERRKSGRITRYHWELLLGRCFLRICHARFVVLFCSVLVLYL